MQKNIVTLSKCTWVKSQNKLVVSSEFFSGIFPSLVTVKSERTGVQVEYVPVEPDDAMFDQDQWDGEAMVYKSKSHQNVPYLMILHEH